MSYKKRHLRQKIRNIKPKKTIFYYLSFWIAAFIFIATSALGYFLFISSYFQVENIEVLGAGKDKKEQIEQQANFYINRNIFLFNSNKFKNNLLASLPDLKEASVQKKFPNDILIKVQERIPFGIYCTISNKCFWIDEQGFLFSEFENNGEENFVIRQNILEKNNISIGQNIVDSKKMEAISKIEKSLREKSKIQVKEFIIQNDEKMDVVVSEGWKIYFKIGKSSNVDFDIVKLSLLLEEEIKNDKRKNLEYIDLRFEDRAYYK